MRNDNMVTRIEEEIERARARANDLAWKGDIKQAKFHDKIVAKYETMQESGEEFIIKF